MKNKREKNLGCSIMDKFPTKLPGNSISAHNELRWDKPLASKKVKGFCPRLSLNQMESHGEAEPFKTGGWLEHRSFQTPSD